MKRCSRCGKMRPLSEFSGRSASKDGLSFMCRDCASEYQRGRWSRYNRRVEPVRPGYVDLG